MPGPLPKRSDERTRRNKTNEAGLTLKKGHATDVHWPEPAEVWEQPVKDLYLGLQQSGMSMFYQQGEVQWIWLACQEFDEYRKSGQRSAMKLQAILSMFSTGLGITEGDRRRMQIELDLPQEEVADDRDDKVVDLKNRVKKRG